MLRSVWHVYLVRCQNGSVYTGVTTDPARRLREHNRGKGGAYTRANRPVELIHRELASDRASALRREHEIKNWSRARKEQFLRDHKEEPKMKGMMRTVHVLLCAALVGQLAGCGTLMYPERKGQKGGRIDAGVAVLDAIGLLFFIIPGVIAFAVDFSEGTIYLPGTLVRSSDPNGMKLAKFDPKHATAGTIEEIIWRQTGRRVKLDQEDVKVSRLESLKELKKRFAKI